MRSGFAFLASLTIALALCPGCAGGGGRSTAGTPAVTPASNFRDVVLSDLDGHPTRLADAVGHQPALISFWAPWCDPCVREQPALQRLSRQVSACGATVVGVAVGETRATINRFVRARRLDFPQLADQDFHLSDALGQRRIPATLVLDANQNVVFTGESLDARAIAALKKAVARDDCAWP
ncbi:MAG TPA: TlpA disulfide reductase family protein [Polyangia bacterium]|jgi:peroxiredoxin